MLGIFAACDLLCVVFYLCALAARDDSIERAGTSADKELLVEFT